MRKIVKMSIVAATLVATSSMAADKGIDIVTTGQAVVYYQSQAGNGNGEDNLFNNKKSFANVGLQLNLDADLKNNFTFGSQLNYLGTAGLEKNVVNGVMQDDNNEDSQFYLSQLYVAKKMGNTNVKVGRQELPLSLSPFAYSEDWSVFKNTFDAILAVNTDIKDTTLVGAYVSGGNYNAANNASMADFGNLTVGGVKNTDPTDPKYKAMDIDGTAYMLTVQNKSIPMATVTGTYYGVQNIIVPAPTLVDADILWGDVAISDKSLPMGLSVGIQGGAIMPDGASNLDSTKAFGAKVSIKPMDSLGLTLAYSHVNDGAVALVNVGGIKTPLYTQMIGNQTAISKDANTFMVKADYDMGEYGAITLQDGYTKGGDANRDRFANGAVSRVGTDVNCNDLELIYKIKAAGVQYFAAFINRTWSEKAIADNQDSQNWVRVWGRYNF